MAQYVPVGDALEIIDDLIQAAEKNRAEQALGSAKLRGMIESLQSLYPDDADAMAITKVYEALMHEAEVRSNDDLTIMRHLKEAFLRIQVQRDWLTKRMNQTDGLLKSMLGIDEDVPEKEIAQRAKDAGEIFSEITRRKKADPKW